MNQKQSEGFIMFEQKKKSLLRQKLMFNAKKTVLQHKPSNLKLLNTKYHVLKLVHSMHLKLHEHVFIHVILTHRLVMVNSREEFRGIYYLLDSQSLSNACIYVSWCIKRSLKSCQFSNQKLRSPAEYHGKCWATFNNE